MFLLKNKKKRENVFTTMDMWRGAGASLTTMLVLRIVGPKYTLAASHADSW